MNRIKQPLLSHSFAAYVLLFALIILPVCQPTDEQRAAALVSEAQQLVDNGRWQQARLLLDSVHQTYPKQVSQRRLAKALSDSITCLEA